MQIAKKLKITPAYLPVVNKWKKEVTLTTEHKEDIITYIDRGEVKPLVGVKKLALEEELKKIIDHNYKKFWLNKLSPAKLTTNIVKAYQQFVDNISVKKKDSKK